VLPLRECSMFPKTIADGPMNIALSKKKEKKKKL
jgi:hypothetical protein